MLYYICSYGWPSIPLFVATCTVTAVTLVRGLGQAEACEIFHKTTTLHLILAPSWSLGCKLKPAESGSMQVGHGGTCFESPRQKKHFFKFQVAVDEKIERIQFISVSYLLIAWLFVLVLIWIFYDFLTTVVTKSCSWIPSCAPKAGFAWKLTMTTGVPVQILGSWVADGSWIFKVNPRRQKGLVMHLEVHVSKWIETCAIESKWWSYMVMPRDAMICYVFYGISMGYPGYRMIKRDLDFETFCLGTSLDVPLHAARCTQRVLWWLDHGSRYLEVCTTDVLPGQMLTGEQWLGFQFILDDQAGWYCTCIPLKLLLPCKIL